MAGPIGVTFMPSAENQQMGGRQGAMEGGGSDLAQAFKVLSLRLPQVLGARAPAPASLLNGAGSAGVAPGQNSNSAMFQAILKAMLGGSMGSPSSGSAPMSTAMPSDAPKFGYIGNDTPQSPGTTQQIGPNDFIARGGGQY